MAHPQVSVVMAVRNGERYLHQSVESILEQTFRDFEFIIVNDGSTDGTQAILEGYRAKEPKVRVVVQKDQCPGQAQPSNQGIALSRGEYIARIDSDDVAAPTRLEEQARFLDSHKDIGLVGAWSRLVDPSGQQIGIWQAPESHHVLQWQLCFANVFSHSSAMFRRGAFSRVGGYDESRFYCEDYDLWCRLSRSTRIACMPAVLVSLRRHQDSVTFSHPVVQRNRHNDAARSHIRALCGEELSEPGNWLLRGDQTGKTKARKEALRLIQALWGHFSGLAGLPREDRRVIRLDAGRRLIDIAWPHVWFHASMWATFAHASRLNPEIPRDALLRKLRPLLVLKKRLLGRAAPGRGGVSTSIDR